MPVWMLSRDSVSHIKESMGRPALPHGSHAGMYVMGPFCRGAISDVPALLAVLMQT